jgi:hypothetical protein
VRFAPSGYYIESYIKCDNCGVLIYDDGLRAPQPEFNEKLFCSKWCIAWFTEKAAGVEQPKIDLPFD